MGPHQKPSATANAAGRGLAHRYIFIIQVALVLAAVIVDMSVLTFVCVTRYLPLGSSTTSRVPILFGSRALQAFEL